jgi:NAD(P)-dependent dehydrogenase (short-subunit alcohol dehydrogenase family)
MAIELAANGITANAIAPGPTEPELFVPTILKAVKERRAS